MNTMPNDLDHTFRQFITIRNLNIMSNCLVKRNNCESQFWLEQYHTTIDKRNNGYIEVVDNVPGSGTMYYFIYVISSNQHTFQMSGNTQISVHTNITPSVGTSDM